METVTFYRKPQARQKLKAIQVKYCVPKGTQAWISLAFEGIYQSFCGMVPGKAER